MRNRRLHHKTARSGIEGLPDHLLGVMLREDEDLDAWQTAANLPRCLQTIQVWHAYVHND